jgi:hypothetical protein
MSDNSLVIRQPRSLKLTNPLSVSNKPSHRIIFRHPAYPEHFSQNVLLSLQAYDHPDGGLHHGTALTACGIVAGNAWNGYFSETSGGAPLTLGRDELLVVGKDYYFHVPHPVGSESS